MLYCQSHLIRGDHIGDYPTREFPKGGAEGILREIYPQSPRIIGFTTQQDS